MKKSLIILAAAAFLAASTPLWGGTVYIPLAGDKTTAEGHTFTTEVRFHNDSGQVRRFTYLFIPARKDGAALDRESLDEVVVLPRVTLKRDDLAPAGEVGLLEINAEDEIAITARLVSVSAEGERKLGTELPVVTSRNAVSPGRTAILQGLERTDGRAESDFYLLNLSIDRSFCAIEVRRRGGALVTEQTLSVPPLSLFPFEDVLRLLNLMNASDVSIAVTCDALSHPFALNQRVDTAEVLFIPPSATGNASLDLFPTTDCPNDALFNLEGVFHTPAGRNERATFTVPTPAGQNFSKIVLDMEFTHGGWNACSSCNHAVFWLNRTSKWAENVFGYLNLFGPNKNHAKLITNVDLPRGVVNAVQGGASFQRGETYSVHYVYDTANRVIEAVISVKGGEELVRIVDFPSANTIRAAESFMVVFGHTSLEEGPERPTFGWQYANLCLQLE